MAGIGNQSRRRGTYYENLAAEYLMQKGFQILHRNFCSRVGEIDLVARQKDYLVFVEVKYRRRGGEHPLEAADVRKQRRICRTADYYCLRYGYQEDTPCRFDVVGISGDEIIHVEDAFSYVIGYS